MSSEATRGIPQPNDLQRKIELTDLGVDLIEERKTWVTGVKVVAYYVVLHFMTLGSTSNPPVHFPHQELKIEIPEELYRELSSNRIGGDALAKLTIDVYGPGFENTFKREITKKEQ